MRDDSDKDLLSEEEYSNLLSEVERWRVVEDLADVIWEVDMNLKFIYISPTVEDLVGYTQEEMLDITMNQLFTPESVSLIEETLAEGLAEHTTDSPRVIPPPIEVEAIHRDGTSVWLELSRVFVRDEENNAVGVIGVARNITNRIHTAHALQESEAKYRAVSEKSVLGIVIAQNNPVRLSYVNNTLADLLGYSKEEMTQWRGAETARLIHPEDREMFFRTFRDRIENGKEPAPYEFRAVRKDGENIWLEVHGTRIEYLNELAVLATFIDITEKHQVQKEMEQERNFAEFLIDLMSHDLNNMHQGMMTALELISVQGSIPPDTMGLLENTISQLNRAGGLISKVRTLSDVKSMNVENIRMDIYEPITKAIDSIKKTFPKREINVELQISSGTYFVFGCQFLVDVFYNLLHNAVKVVTAEPVLLQINAEALSRARLQVAIADNGPGIPDSMKSSIIGRLGDKDTIRSGIGLTLVKQILNRCKGEVWVEDRVKGDYSQGAKFVIQLQVHQD